MLMQVTHASLPLAAQRLLQTVRGGDIVTFSGPLAAGKTTFVQALLQLMGYNGRVASPTFVLERRYPVEWKTINQVIHLDFYRLTPEEVRSFDWHEHAGAPDTLTLIEWPEIAEAVLPEGTKKVVIAILDQNTREITFEGQS